MIEQIHSPREQCQITFWSLANCPKGRCFPSGKLAGSGIVRRGGPRGRYPVAGRLRGTTRWIFKTPRRGFSWIWIALGPSRFRANRPLSSLYAAARTRQLVIFVANHHRPYPKKFSTPTDSFRNDRETDEMNFFWTNGESVSRRVVSIRNWWEREARAAIQPLGNPRLPRASLL